MKTKIIISVCILIIASAFTGCEKKPGTEAAIRASDVTIAEKEIEIIETKTIREFVTGCDFDRGEVYAKAVPDLKDKHVVQIIDINTGKIKKKLAVRRGSFKSPTDFYSPTYMEFLDGAYYIVDQMEKIVVFDDKLKHIFSSMFPHYRYFIDFFLFDGRKFFVIATKTPYISRIDSKIELYEVKKTSRPTLLKKLYATDFVSLRPLNKGNKKFRHKGILWPSPCGFEKNGKIYYSAMTENRYYVYDLKTKKNICVELSYLKPKKYSNDDAARFGFYKSDGWEERFYKKSKKKIVYNPYTAAMYHFGLYDAGENKIGVIGDIDTAKMTFRLDIIDSVSHSYRESLRLPCGIGLSITLSDSNRGFVNSYIDVDKGIYVWEDIEGEDFDYLVKITKFKVIENSIKINNEN